ncbi:MAG TPA: sulfite exporter TauE/SafE family protein [Burkholderiales bacterium]|nr:sulfite exporter TauE/SafE family protein [Burkholderiales bacterium]
MPFDLNMLIIAVFIVLVAYLLFALSGFGSTLITIPLFAHLYPLTFVLPMLALLDTAAAMRLGLQSRGHLLRHELAWLLPCMAVGMIAGVALLVKLPAQLVLGTLGGLVAAYGLYSLSGRGIGFRLPQRAAVPVGLAGGVLSSLFGVGGPLYVMYLTARGHNPLQVRSTITTLLSVTTLTRVVLFALYGLYAQNGILLFALALAPAMLVGLYAGHRLHLNLSKRRLMQSIAVLLIASGASLLVRALA